MPLIALLIFAALDHDEPPPRLWVSLGVNGGARIRSDAVAIFAGGLEVAGAPLTPLRLRLTADGVWEGSGSTGSRGGYRFLGGADALFHQWWGQIFAGLAGGAFTDLRAVSPMGTVRAGFDITLALPIFVGFALGWGLAVPERGALLQFVELGGRIGLAW
ncbi:MAG: hypothetical protein IPJ65_16555 [Archangiaceae bacterium]|nr:hypothetical protein [Archangiaceae bacterium]